MMTFIDSNQWWIKVERKDKLAGVSLALLFHAVLFFMSGKVFIKAPQFSVKSSVNHSMEVNLVSPVVEPVKTVIPIKEEKQIEIPKKEDIVVPVQVKEVSKVEPVKQKEPHPAADVRTEAKPDYFQNPAPPYPELAKQMHQEGTVILEVEVNKDGMPENLQIKTSSGYRLLDQAALKAVSHWRFYPGRIGELAVESKVTVPVRFKIEINQR